MISFIDRDDLKFMITKENVEVKLKYVGVKLKFMISFIGKDDFFMVKY